MNAVMTERRVTVFASSSGRTPQVYLDAAAQLGTALSHKGWIVRNGAGHQGCMGALNDACLAAGGTVEGVNLQRFVDQGFIHPRLTKVVVTDTMRERKRLLGDGVCAFVTLPGGPGTWEELWEVVVERQIDTHNKAVILCNIDGFYDGFAMMLARAEREGLLYGAVTDLLHITDSVAATMNALEQLAQSSPA